MYTKLQKIAAVKFSETDPSVYLEQHLLHLSALCTDPTKGVTLPSWLKKGRGTWPGTLGYLQQTDLREVRETAMTLAEWVHSMDLFVGRHAISVSIGLILIALEGTRQCGLPKVADVANELGKVNGVGAWTCMERYREVAKAVLDWAEYLPGVELASRHYTVHDRTGWKHRTTGKRKEVSKLVLDVLRDQAQIRARRAELGLEVGGSYNSAANRPQLTLAEFEKLERATGGRSEPKDIGAWGAQAAVGKDAAPLATWDELGDTVVVAPAAAVSTADADPSNAAEPSRSSASPPRASAIPPPTSSVPLPPKLATSPPPSTYEVDAEYPHPTLPSAVAPPGGDLSFFPLSAPLSYSFSGGYGSFDSAMATFHGVSDSLIDPALLDDAQPRAGPSSVGLPPAPTPQLHYTVASPDRSSGPSVSGTQRGHLSSPPVATAAVASYVSASKVSAAPSEFTVGTGALRMAPTFAPNPLEAKHFRPAAYMRNIKPKAVRERSLWLKPEAVAAVRESGNDVTALGKLLCAGVDVDALPAFLAPTSTLGAVAALREGGASAIDDDELFNDGELDAYVRTAGERKFLLSVWDREGLVGEMDAYEVKAAAREAAEQAKAVRRRERAARKGKPQTQYAGSRRTKAQPNFNVDAIAVLLGQRDGGGSGGGHGAETDGEDDGGGLEALAQEFGADPEADAAGKAGSDDDDVHDDDASDADDAFNLTAADGPRSSSPAGGTAVAGSKRARDAQPDEAAEWQAFSKRSRILYGADGDGDGDGDDAYAFESV